jgi:hypothetical protein
MKLIGAYIKMRKSLQQKPLITGYLATPKNVISLLKYSALPPSYLPATFFVPPSVPLRY